ncbi:MAG: Gfo/Idh/MocA family oxidoreductase [Verrucomicrobiae bacterium]|nr:Gfo/Idh/MocA family oxidoreductase [Verrucomicrobiae bacterium]
MNPTTRRTFLKQSTTLAVGAAAFHIAPGLRAQSANEKFTLGIIGPGGMGTTLLKSFTRFDDVNIASVSDVDANRLAAAVKNVETLKGKTPKAEKDFRRILEDKSVDAVVIATPNHHHALPALMAIRRGIHVYLEKPLTHTIHESRQLRDEAKRYGVVTQMGQHGHSNEGCRRLCEYIWAGAIGQVREVHCWAAVCDGLPDAEHSPPLPVPEGLDWDTWIGPAPFRNFHADLHPHGWHLWHDFGNGSVGNWGCHLIDPAYWALKLGAPEAVEVEDICGGGKGVWPIRTRIRWDFPAREGMDPVKVYFYDGIAPGVPYNEETVSKRWRFVAKREWQNLPPLVVELEKKYKRNFGRGGSLLVGTKGIMTIGEFGDGCRMVPEEAQRAFPVPDKVLPRVKGTHQEDFFRACRGGAPACANFEYSAPLAEIVLLGNIAILAGLKRRVEWDSAAMRCTNLPELDRYLKQPSREGWSI